MSNALRKRLAELLEDIEHIYFWHEMADEVIAALPGMVLPLAWECTDWSAGDGIKGENDCEWTADVWPMTSYIISWFGGERFEINTPEDKKITATSLAAAKAAAQAHYTAQIMAAFGIDAAAMKEGKDA